MADMTPDDLLKAIAKLAVGNSIRNVYGVGIHKTPDILATMSLHNACGFYMAETVVADTTGSGGKLFESFLNTPVKKLLYRQEGEVDAYEAVLVAFSEPAALEKLMELLPGFKGKSAVGDFGLHDLRKCVTTKSGAGVSKVYSKNIANQNAAWNAYKADVDSNTRPVIAIIDKSQTVAINDAGMHGDRAVAGGIFSDAGLEQFDGRLGRPGKRKAGSLLSTEYNRVHIRFMIVELVLAKKKERDLTDVSEPESIVALKGKELTGKQYETALEEGKFLSTLTELHFEGEPIPLETFVECIKSKEHKEKFMKEYKAVYEHHKNCTFEMKGRGKKKVKVYKDCCKECTSLASFKTVEEGDDA